MRNPFRCFNSSPEVIHLTVMRYIRYSLSLRQVEDLLLYSVAHRQPRMRATQVLCFCSWSAWQPPTSWGARTERFKAVRRARKERRRQILRTRWAHALRRTLRFPMVGSGRYAAALVQRKSSSSIHMRWRVTAILRARATFARRDPWRPAIRIAHAFIADHLVDGRRTTFAASKSAVRVSPSPTLLIRPTRSISPD
jgi:hypothetical protein